MALQIWLDKNQSGLERPSYKSIKQSGVSMRRTTWRLCESVRDSEWQLTSAVNNCIIKIGNIAV